LNESEAVAIVRAKLLGKAQYLLLPNNQLLPSRYDEISFQGFDAPMQGDIVTIEDRRIYNPLIVVWQVIQIWRLPGHAPGGEMMFQARVRRVG